MNSSILCFTVKGAQTAARILAVLQDPAHETERDNLPGFGADQKYEPNTEQSTTVRAWCKKKGFSPGPPVENWEDSIHEWTKEQFERCDAIIFVGATGIAVRSIAPFLVSKVLDPAVIAVDEQGNYVISLVSGHIGGANELCRKIAGGIGAVPIISTATDLNGKFAVDVFARKNDLWISSMKLAKELSAALLDGKRIAFSSELSVKGSVPEELCMLTEAEQPHFEWGRLPSGAERPHVEWERLPSGSKQLSLEPNSQFPAQSQPEIHFAYPGILSKSGAPHLCISRTLSEREKSPGTLFLIPRSYVLGIGCRAGKTAPELEEFVLRHLNGLAIPIRAVRMVCSIDVKAKEPGLLEFCGKYELPFVTYSGDVLAEVGGEFSGSAFVRDHVGVDNVCERSAVKGSGGGKLIMRKQAENGMTMALAYQERSVQF